jgi:hypothetical protein
MAEKDWGKVIIYCECPDIPQFDIHAPPQCHVLISCGKCPDPNCQKVWHGTMKFPAKEPAILPGHPEYGVDPVVMQTPAEEPDPYGKDWDWKKVLNAMKPENSSVGPTCDDCSYHVPEDDEDTCHAPKGCAPPSDALCYEDYAEARREADEEEARP